MKVNIKLRATVNTILVSCIILLVTACGEPETTYTHLENDAVILAFGDSLTYGTGTSEEFCYPSILEDLTGLEVINEGVPGEVTSTGLQRLPDLLDEYQPQLLILIHGGNDILRKVSRTKTTGNLKKMIALAEQRDIKVVMLGVPIFSILSLDSAEFYEQVATEEGVPINLDVLPEILSNNNFKSDRIHPNKQGYKMMAEAVYQLLIDSGVLIPSSNDGS